MQSSTTKHMLLGQSRKENWQFMIPNEKTRTDHVTKGKSCHIKRKKQTDVTVITLSKAKEAKTILKQTIWRVPILPETIPPEIIKSICK